MTSFRTSPSTQDIWSWTFTKEAIAPCFIRDVLSMKETNTKDVDFYWLGHIPCRVVLVIGVVVGIQDYEKRTLYTIDDSTAVIDCVFRHPSPPKVRSTLSGLGSPLYISSSSSLLPPPPTPITAIGYPVQVIGKVIRFHDSRQIIAESIEPCQSTNDQWKHWKKVVELHKSKYCVPKPFEIPALVSVCETGSEELATEGLPTVTSMPVSSSSRQSLAQTSKANIPTPHTPIKRVSYDPSSPLTNITSSAPSSPLKPGSTEMPKLRHPSRLRTRDLTQNTFRLYLKHYMDYAPITSSSQPPDPDIDGDPFTTPTKRPRVDIFDQTPKARTMRTAHDQTPHATGVSLWNTSPSGFTLSHLRRVPELALLAGRVVRAEIKRRARAESEAQQSKVARSSRSDSHATKSTDVPRLKIKRLFSWAVLKLYEEGSIVLWDGPVRPLPVPVSLQTLSSSDTTTNNLWKAADSTMSSTANSTMFSSTSISSSKIIASQDGYLSDPPPHEEEESYVSLTPALLAEPVREVMHAKGVYSGNAKKRVEEITGYLRRGDERWARVGAWAVEEAMEIVLAEWR